MTRNAHRILFWESRGERQFGRWRKRWEDNIQVDLVENTVKMEER
jgi:hypothetical protein